MQAFIPVRWWICRARRRISAVLCRTVKGNKNTIKQGYVARYKIYKDKATIKIVTTNPRATNLGLLNAAIKHI